MRKVQPFVLSDTRWKLRKSPKSELARELKNLLGESCPTTVPEFGESLRAMVVIDCMANDR